MAPPPHMPVGSLDRSHNSSSTDMSRLGDDPLDANRTHHLLKHCLSDGQRGEALAHFSTDDVKEAAKEISKMGQRDLQGKFRLVYGTATHSNNNDWLRRKLYEAIGAAPIKAATKSKPRKAGSKPRKPAGVHQGAAKSPRSGGSSLPGSPMAGRSVLDVHRLLGHESATTSASEGASDTWEEEEVSERAGPRESSAFAAAAAARAALPAPPPPPPSMQQLRGMALARRASSFGLSLGMSLNMDSLQSASDVWSSDAWADVALKAAAARLAPAAMPSVEDDDVLMLPMDLSAFNEDAAALL
jgi:hypothetical protein